MRITPEPKSKLVSVQNVRQEYMWLRTSTFRSIYILQFTYVEITDLAKIQ